MNEILTQREVQFFHKNGYLVLRKFYDLKQEIEPIQWHIYKIISVLIEKYELPIQQSPFTPDTFDSGYQDLIRYSRRIGSEIYDAVKQIPAFVRLVVCTRHDQLMMQIRSSDLPGVASGGYGIRIDNPGEEKFRANWHQDYPSQLRSLDGLVFWSHLVEITPELGPPQLAIASHKKVIMPITTKDQENPEKTGAYAVRLKNETQVLAQYEKMEALLSPGDLLILDFLNIHASGFNRANRSRWSMQMRYLNYLEPIGQKIGWAGSFAVGTSISAIHPELVLES